MGNYPSQPDGPPTCGGSDDATCQPVVVDFTDWLPILFYLVWALTFVLCATWVCVRAMVSGKNSNKKKNSRLKQRRSTANFNDPPRADVELADLTDVKMEEGKADVEKPMLTSNQRSSAMLPVVDVDLMTQGYKDHVFGTITYVSLWAFSLSWLLLWLIIYIDYYNLCQWGGVDNLCFYGNKVIFGSYDVDSTVMFFTWVCSLFWFAFVIAMSSKFRNLCRVPCKLDEASVVWVWRRCDADVVSARVWRVVELFRKCHQKCTSGHEGTEGTAEVKSGTFRYFEFQCTRYVIENNDCVGVEASMNAPIEGMLSSKGLTSSEQTTLVDKMGQNTIPFEVDSMYTLVSNEIMNPFYLYQFAVYTVWIWFSYLVVALCMCCIVLLSFAANVYLCWKGQHTIMQMIKYTTDVEVLRDGKWQTMNAEELVPGDVVKVQGDNWVLPCDMMVLNGAVVLDESGLTGESMPVRKAAPPSSAEHYDVERHKKFTLFAGTKVLQSGQAGEEVKAIVTSTGIYTDKGTLISMILFPKKMVFRYDEEMDLVFVLLIIFGVIVFPFVIWFQTMAGANSSWITKFVYGIFTLSQILSPLLPIALVAGQNMASQRLSALGVNCINPKRIAISGKIRVFCFDKTGTLTKDGLDFLGVHLVTDGAFNANVSNDVAEIDQKVMDGLSTCHAVAKFGDRFVGNQVEVRMFEWSGYALVPGGVEKGDSKLKIVKRFEFDHGRMAMSVVVRYPDGQCVVFTKGSFEKIGEFATPETLPSHYHHTSKGHAIDGCYVLGLCCRALGNMDDAAIDGLTRDEVELMGQSTFLSLVMFRNELKPCSRDAIVELKGAAVRPVMITGDNAQCGYYIANQCGMLGEVPAAVYLAEMRAGDVVWTEMLSSKVEREPNVITTQEALQKMGSLELAVTGNAFRALCESGDMEHMLLRTRIFARMGPDDKVRAVEMHLEKDLVTGMCGDGGNDCGALRAAQAGVALSEAEASVVSPFTAKTKSVRAVVDLLREGRAALANSFAGYKFLIIYGQLFCVMKLSFFYLGVVMSMMCYILVDVLMVTFMSYVVTLSRPTAKLEAPSRPTATLLGPETLVSVLGFQVFNIIALVVSLVCLMDNNPAYIKWPAELSSGAAWWTLGDNFECTYIFYVVASLFLWSSIIFSFGGRFRRSVFHNYMLIAFFLFFSLFLWIILVAPPTAAAEAFHVATINFNRQYTTSEVWSAYQAREMNECLLSESASDLATVCTIVGLNACASNSVALSRAITDAVVTNTSLASLNGVVTVGNATCGPYFSTRGMNHSDVWSLLGLIWGIMVLAAIFELVVVQGPIRRCLRERYPLINHVKVDT